MYATVFRNYFRYSGDTDEFEECQNVILNKSADK